MQASKASRKEKPFMVTPDVWGSNARCTLFIRNNAASGAADIGLLIPRLRAAVYHVINVAMFVEFKNVLVIDSEGSVLYNVYKVEKRFFSMGRDAYHAWNL